MISKEILKKVRHIEIQTKGLVNNLFSGEYQSAFKGRGMVFSEVREYQYGDDIRQIDWNVTARYGEPYIKIFEEEREQTLMLCVDVSQSESFGSDCQSKQHLATEICAILAFSAIRNGDKVGLILFSDQIEKVIMPKKGKKHVLRLIRELFTIEPKGRGTNIAQALDYVNKILNRRSIVIMASDFIDKDFEKQTKITNRKHDLVNLLISDKLEFELPSLGIIPIKNPETDEIRWIDTSNKTLRNYFNHVRLKTRESLLKMFSRQQVDTISIYTNDSYIEPLMTFFKRRAQRY